MKNHSLIMRNIRDSQVVRDVLFTYKITAYHGLLQIWLEMNVARGLALTEKIEKFTPGRLLLCWQ